MQSQKLLPKGEVLQEEFFSGAKDGDDPAEQRSMTQKHQGIIAKSAPRRCACKLLILRTRRVLARGQPLITASAICAFRRVTGKLGDRKCNIQPTDGQLAYRHFCGSLCSYCSQPATRPGDVRRDYLRLDFTKAMLNAMTTSPVGDC